MDVLLTAIVHWMHVFLGIFWFGTVLYTRLVLFPSLKAVPSETERTVREALLTGRSRRFTQIFAYGTVTLGIIRGALSGVFGELDTLYARTYLTALALGVIMVVYLFAPLPFRHPILPKLYVAAFPVMFTLMVLMRFGY
jgi:uncharacterized membrane protein